MKRLSLPTLLAATLIAANTASANNGTLLTGYGAKAQGMGGVSLAFPQDALAAANNPAGMAYVGQRFDIGAQIVGVWTESRTGPLSYSGSSLTPVPEFGVNWQINDRMTFGISSSAAGAAMYYDSQLFTGAPGGTDGLFLAATILPTLTYKVTDELAVGVSLAATAQALKLDNFPGVASNKFDWATGLGWRAGVMWTPQENVSFGAMYASKIRMSSFSEYEADILAPVGGKLDIPEQFGLGVAFHATQKLTIGLDYLHINWSDTQYNTAFGYRDQDVFRIGASYDVNDEWTVRAGGSFAQRHITSDFVNQNILLSAINPKAISVGATRRLSNGGELTMGFEYDYGGRLDGTGASAGSRIETDFAVASISYGMNF